ncbi:protease inhibitor I9 family protein [Janthinobacterium sp. 64]|uniref:protease inhibitor I9 family protein n=1 Tax=Janthinobacterium sp. 64 TaxID=2035208 RepID=UPI000CB5DDD5|nr:protease inhibitor I9 family protein [Janthinobacterium sp. 64]PKB24240.1 peptidase inhibitor I9 [Janthinobacterium sp. 64]
MPAFHLGLVILAGAMGPSAAPARQAYIVQLPVQLPAAAQREARATQAEAQRRAVLALVPEASVQHHYTATLNGFAALLTPAEVKRLRASPLVARVSPSTEEHVNDSGARSVPDAQR